MTTPISQTLPSLLLQIPQFSPLSQLLIELLRVSESSLKISERGPACSNPYMLTNAHEPSSHCRKVLEDTDMLPYPPLNGS
jgi:hypothetical protein